ncbi:MAG: phosphohistidine phosphatase SixA [Bacteroidia bacterium]
MKKLWLVRHAKSSWSNLSLPDIDRPLNERGYRDAHEMPDRVFKNKEPGIPELLISSSAIRALSTALIFARKFGYNEAGIRIEPELYETSVASYLNIVRHVPEHLESVMLFGHNPIMTDFLNLLTNAGIENIPTTGVACISWNGSWSAIGEGCSLVLYEFPKKTA